MDRYGKVVEVILLPGTDENGYFDYFANVAKRLPWGHNATPQNNKQKSIVINNNNEIWVCQYIHFPRLSSGAQEVIIHMNAKGEMKCVDSGIPDSDEYRLGTPDLWTALGVFISISMNTAQVKRLEQAVSKNSNGVFSYQHDYYDVRSYRLGRSATMQEVATMLSAKIER